MQGLTENITEKAVRLSAISFQPESRSCRRWNTGFSRERGVSGSFWKLRA